MAVRLGGCLFGLCRVRLGKEERASLETNDFVPIVIRKCYSQCCPHAIHFIQCLSANSLKAGWAQIQQRLCGFEIWQC